MVRYVASLRLCLGSLQIERQHLTNFQKIRDANSVWRQLQRELGIAPFFGDSAKTVWVRFGDNQECKYSFWTTLETVSSGHPRRQLDAKKVLVQFGDSH